MPHQLKGIERFENLNSRQQTLPMWLLQPRKLKCHLPISIQATKTDTTRFAAPGQVQYLTAGAAGQKTWPTLPAWECATGDVHTSQHHQLQPIRTLKTNRRIPILSVEPFSAASRSTFERNPIFFRYTQGS